MWILAHVGCIMLSTNFNPFQKLQFSSACMSTLLQKVCARRLWKKSKFLVSLMPKSLQSPWMQVKHFCHIVCSMRMVKDLWKFFKVRNLTRWWTSSKPSILPTFETSLHLWNTMLVLEAPWIPYFSLSQRFLMITSKIIISLDKWLGRRCLCLKCHSMGQQVGLIWWGTCNLVVICRIIGWCLIMSSVFKNGPPCLVMFMTSCTAKCPPLQFVTCNLNPHKLSVSFKSTKPNVVQVWSYKPQFQRVHGG